MSRDLRTYLDDIEASCDLVEHLTSGKNRENALGNKDTLDTILRNLELIAEDINYLPEDLRYDMPDVNWQQVHGLEDILRDRPDDETIWEIVQNLVPQLHDAVTRATV